MLPLTMPKLGNVTRCTKPFLQFASSSRPGTVISVRFRELLVIGGGLVLWKRVPLEITAADGGTVTLSGPSWGIDGTMQARWRSLSAHYDLTSHTLHYSWEGDHPREQNIPRHYGVGTITFHVDPEQNASLAEGWFSSSNASDVKEAFVTATSYVRATSEELEALNGTDRDKRASVINAKLRDRVKFDT